jgi:hypothetical protein
VPGGTAAALSIKRLWRPAIGGEQCERVGLVRAQLLHQLGRDRFDRRAHDFSGELSWRDLESSDILHLLDRLLPLTGPSAELSPRRATAAVPAAGAALRRVLSSAGRPPLCAGDRDSLRHAGRPRPGARTVEPARRSLHRRPARRKLGSPPAAGESIVLQGSTRGERRGPE